VRSNYHNYLKFKVKIVTYDVHQKYLNSYHHLDILLWVLMLFLYKESTLELPVMVTLQDK